MPILLNLVLISLSVMCMLAFGQEPQISALSFQDWKEQQVLETQNQMLRVSSRINVLKSSKAGKSDSRESTVLPNGRVKKTPDTDTLAAAEKEMKRSQESLEAASALQMDDYITIYLPTLQDQPEALNKLANKMTKEELAEIFKGILKRTPKPVVDAKRNTVSSLEGAASPARAKGL